MMPSNTEEEFLRQYNGKQVKEDRKKYGGEKGNFFNSPDGSDLVPSVYLTTHAKKRISERGVNQHDALKCTSKSGAIKKGRAVVTVIPEAWSSSQSKKLDKDKSKSFGSTSGQDVRTGNHRHISIPPSSNLPIGSCKVDILVTDSRVMGMILGTRQSNILTLIQKYSHDIKHKVNGNKIVIWGPEMPVKRVVEDINQLKTKYAAMQAPDELPIGHSSKRIVVTKAAIGAVIGKGGKTIKQLREESKASISFDSTAGIMFIWGISEEVNKTADTVAKIVDTNKAIDQAIKKQETKKQEKKCKVAWTEESKKKEDRKSKQKDKSKDQKRKAARDKKRRP